MFNNLSEEERYLYWCVSSELKEFTEDMFNKCVAILKDNNPPYLREKFLGTDGMLLYTICKTDEPTYIEQLLQHFRPNIRSIFQKIFYICCANDMRKNIEWLVSKYGKGIMDKEAFIAMCMQNRLSLVKWTVDNFSRECIAYDEGFYIACNNGHLKLAKYLAHKFKDVIDVYGEEQRAFRRSLGLGFMDVAVWLHKNYDFSIKEGYEGSLYFACYNNKLRAVEWILCNYPNEKPIPEYFFFACRANNIDMLKILLDACPNPDLTEWEHLIRKVSQNSTMTFLRGKNLLN